MDGARVGTTALYGPGRRLEFSAAFNGAAFDAAGFGTNFLTAPMARFATRLFGLVIYANTNNGEERLSSLAGLFLGAQHRYRIDWTDTGFAYATDGIPRVTHLLGVGREMRPLFSDLFVGGKELILDWIRMSPYERSGGFTSRVFDGGASVVWTGLAATTDLPAGTAIELETRTGGTPVPDDTWSPWAPVAGGTIGSPGGRFIQYRVNLSTSDRDVTPVLSSVALSLFADCTPEVCNGGEVCAGGACMPGEAPDCEDGDPCTEDSCEPASGCRHDRGVLPQVACSFKPATLNLTSQGNPFTIEIVASDACSPGRPSPAEIGLTRIARAGNSPFPDPVLLECPGTGGEVDFETGLFENPASREATDGGGLLLRFDRPSDGRCDTLDGGRPDLVDVLRDVPDGATADVCITGTLRDTPFQCCAATRVLKRGNRK